MDKIWNWLSSHTNCLFRILREVGAELKVFIKGLPTLQQVIQIALAKFLVTAILAEFGRKSSYSYPPDIQTGIFHATAMNNSHLNLTSPANCPDCSCSCNHHRSIIYFPCQLPTAETCRFKPLHCNSLDHIQESSSVLPTSDSIVLRIFEHSKDEKIPSRSSIIDLYAFHIHAQCY